jgi:hypothetical protein
MGLFGKLLRLTVDVVTLPVNAVSDVFTLGGELSESGESAVKKKLEKIEEELDEIADDD